MTSFLDPGRPRVGRFLAARHAPGLKEKEMALAKTANPLRLSIVKVVHTIIYAVMGAATIIVFVGLPGATR